MNRYSVTVGVSAMTIAEARSKVKSGDIDEILDVDLEESEVDDDEDDDDDDDPDDFGNESPPR